MLLSPYLMGPAQTLGPMAGPQMPQAAPQMAPGAFPAAPHAPGRFAGVGQRLRGMLAPEIALPAAAAMMQGRNLGESVGGAFGVMGQGLALERQRQDEMQQKNLTRMWLMSEIGLNDMQADQAMSNPAILNHFIKAKTTGAEGNEFFGTPLFTEDADGNIIPMQLSKSGTAKPVDLQGNKLASPTKEVDTGTEIITYDRFGKELFRQPKQNYQREFDSGRGGVEGKAAGEATVAMGGARQQAAKIRMQVEDLKNDPYLPRMLGPVDSRLPNVSADAARVQSKIDQLSGGAFLEGRQMLKGGGAITDFESNKAEQALIRMNTAQNEADFKAALEEFAQAVEAGVRKLEAAAARGVYIPGQSAPTPNMGAVPGASGGYRILSVD